MTKKPMTDLDMKVLGVLQARCNALHAMMPSPEAVMASGDLDPDDFQRFHADIEMIASELHVTSKAIQALLGTSS